MKILQPYLTDEQGRTLSVVDGVVVTNPLPNPLDDTPKGWEKTAINYTRNKEFLGMVKSYTTPLQFFFEGAKILRTYFYTKGIESILYFIWLKLDQSFGGGMLYKGYYKGEVDLSTFKDEDSGVTAIVNEGGLYKDLNANKNVPYNIEFDDDTVSVIMDGLLIFNEAQFSVSEGVGYTGLVNFTPSVATLVVDGTNFALDVPGQSFETVPTAILDYEMYFLTSSNYILKNLTDSTQVVNIKGQIKFVCTTNGTAPQSSISFQWWTSYSRALGFIFSITPVVNTIYTYDIDVSFTLQRHEALFIFGKMGSVNPALFNVEFLEGSTLSIGWQNKYQTTVINALPVFDLGKKLISKISNGVSTLQSNLLSSDTYTLVTCGDAVRGIPEAIIKTKFSDYYKSVDAIKCACFQVESNNGRIELRSYAFDSSSEIVNLGEVSEFELTAANDYRYDTINVGYQTTDIDKVNGKYSFCNTIVFKLPNKRNKNSYDIISEYKADPYVIEQLRINLEGKKTTDNKSDSDVFFLDCVKAFQTFANTATFVTATKTITIIGTALTLYPNTRFYNSIGDNIGYFTIVTSEVISGNTILTVKESIIDGTAVAVDFDFKTYTLRRNYYVFTGVPTDTVFNVELSPRRNLIKHHRWIAGACDLMSGNITFQTTDKNKLFATDDTEGNIVTECEDLLISELTVQSFKPYELNFKAQSRQNLIDLMDASKGYFSFTVNGIKYQGYPMNIISEDVTLDTHVFRLLATQNNNLSNLINGR